MIQDFVPNSGYKKVCKYSANKREKDIKNKSGPLTNAASSLEMEQ
jgi:hypothetical protein